MPDKPRRSVFKRRDLLSKKIPFGMIVVRPESGDFVELGEVETLLWNLLKRESSLNKLVNEVCKIFQVSRQEATDDISQFLIDAEKAGFIERKEK